MKWTLMAVAALIGSLFMDTTTIAPTSVDYGKASVAGVVTRTFKITRSDSLKTVLTLEGPNPDDFMILGTVGAPSEEPKDVLYGCEPARGAQVGTCEVQVEFRPTSPGIKSATLVATDSHGQKATAALRGEGVVPKCTPDLVPCNWAISYMGTITIHEVDSTINSEKNARYETTLDVMIDQGRVTCKGMRNEFDQTLVDDKPTEELSFVGAITGPGLAAIEFQPDAKGRMTYLLTYACATPEGTRESKSFRFGNSEVEKVKAEKAEWRDAVQVGDPQPVAGDPGMSPIVGKSLTTSWDPANKQGSYIRANWTLRTP